VELHVSEELPDLWTDQNTILVFYSTNYLISISFLNVSSTNLFSAHNFRMCGLYPDRILTDIILPIWFIFNIHGNLHITFPYGN